MGELWGQNRAFFKAAEIIACLCAAGQDLVEREINDVGGKGTIAGRTILLGKKEWTLCSGGRSGAQEAEGSWGVGWADKMVEGTAGLC